MITHAADLVPAHTVDTVADRAVRDAIALVVDVHDIDTRVAWGRLAAWGRDDPQRLRACAFALAAMVDPDKRVSQLLAWTRWRRS